MRVKSQSVVENNQMQQTAEIVVPPKLTKPSSAINITEQLELIALSLDSDSAFYCALPSHSIHVVGDQNKSKHLDLKKLIGALSSEPDCLKTLSASELSTLCHINNADSCELVCMLVTDKFKNNLCFVGVVVSSNTNDVVRLNSSEHAIFTKSQLTLCERLIRQLADRVYQQERKRQAYGLHSLHLQLSALNQDYICIKDAQHHLIYANPAFVSTFPERVRRSLLGTDSTKHYNGESRKQIIETDLCALTNGIYKGVEKLTLANGEDKILQTIKKVFVGEDERKYVMSISRDITEKEILINDLKRSNADLDNFAYVASHDLKAPLNAIKRLVTWVKEDCDKYLPSESKEDLEIVLNRTDRMQKLLNDLLSYARIGKDYQAATKINLRDFVVELLTLLDLPMGFVLNCDSVDIQVPTIPFNVVMLNLVSNAIKHHDSGNAKIQIKAKSNDKGCTISILDNGPGIAEKNHERIFELFETLKSKDDAKGSGMGLSVVKKIVEHYGGYIKVAANKPRGSKFTVYWPTRNIARTVLDSLHD